jgi:hypothetical protein
MKYGQTAYNKTVHASPPVGSSGYVLARSFRYAPQLRWGTFPLSDYRASGYFTPPHFFSPGRVSYGSDAVQSPYSGCKNFLIAVQAASKQPER